MKNNSLSNFSFSLFFGITILFTSISFAQDQREIKIRERVRQYEDAFNRKDAKAVASIYDDDATHTYADGITDSGKEAIEKGLAVSFAGPMKDVKIKLTPERFRFLKDDIVIENACFVLTGLKLPDGTEMPPMDGLCLVIYQFKDDNWYVAAAQCMLPPPPPQN